MNFDPNQSNRMITMANSIHATPDPKNKSTDILLLKHGETVTQSDHHSNNAGYNAVKLFNHNLSSFWACNLKDMPNISPVDKVNRSFKTNPYKKVSTFASQYQGGHPTDVFRTFSTPTIDGQMFSGSWAQITYPYAFYPETMSIQVAQGVYTTERQRQVPKSVVICASQDDYNVDDVDKKWELLAEYDFGDKYATIIEISYKGIYGKEYFSLYINGQLYSSYNCSTVEKHERIAIGGLDELKLIFINKKDFATYGPLSKPGIVLTNFRVNGKEMRDNIVHETRITEYNPNSNDYTLHAAGGYDLKAGFPGDAETPCFMPLILPTSKHLFYKPVRSLRMIVKELYGGESFNIAEWKINGSPIGRGPNAPNRPVMLLEGFTGKQISQRPTVDNNIYNGLFTSTPQISGVSLRKPLTIKEGFTSVQEENQNQAYSGSIGGASGPMETEVEIVKALKEFNEAYSAYIHCNGLHLAESDRSIKSASNPNGRCDPKVNYHRQIKKIIFSFTTGSNTNSGSNKFKTIQLLGIPDGETTVRPLGEPFNEVDSTTFNVSTNYTFEYENEIDENGDIVDKLGGLGAYKGVVTGIRLIFETSRLEFVKLKVTVFDTRGGTDPNNPDIPVAMYTLMNYDGAGYPISETEQTDGTGNRNTAVDVAGRSLYFYTDGFQNVDAKATVLATKLSGLLGSDVTKKQTLTEYNAAHTAQEGLIGRFKELRYELDMKMREIYKLEGTNAANGELTYNGTLFSGMLWTALTASVLYYTFFEMDN